MDDCVRGTGNIDPVSTSEPWPLWATERVEIVPHDPGWRHRAVHLAASLDRLLAPSLVLPVEHVGSTAVAGLAAKPVIDLQAAVADLEGTAHVTTALAQEDWHLVPPELDRRPCRRLYVLPADDKRLAHLHLMAIDNPRWHISWSFATLCEPIHGSPRSTPASSKPWRSNMPKTARPTRTPRPRSCDGSSKPATATIPTTPSNSSRARHPHMRSLAEALCVEGPRTERMTSALTNQRSVVLEQRGGDDGGRERRRRVKWLRSADIGDLDVCAVAEFLRNSL